MKQIDKHREWHIYKLSVTTPKNLPIYVAVKNGRAIEGVDVPDLKAEIDEAEK